MTDFPAPTPLEWREAAQKALKERPIESLMHLDADQLVTRPLYAGATGVQPIFAPKISTIMSASIETMNTSTPGRSNRKASPVWATLLSGVPRRSRMEMTEMTIEAMKIHRQFTRVET